MRSGVIITGVMEMKASGQISTGSDMAACDVLFVCPEEKRRMLLEQVEEMPTEFRNAIAEVYNSFFCLSEMDRNSTEQVIADYFSILVEFLKIAEEERSAFREGTVDYSRAVEELYLLGCERNKNTNSYLIPAWHPVRVINALVEHDLAELLSGEEGARQSVLEAVFDAQNRNRRQIKLFCKNQVYETSTKAQNGPAEACVFRQKEGNTDIHFLRTWEKIHSFQGSHPGQKKIEIAVFGKLFGNKESVEKLLEPDIEISWNRFKNVPSMGEYYFQDTHEEQIFDLSNLYDTRELARKYNIILFLDINCMYRQWQTEKTVDERNIRSYSKWCLDRSEVQNGFKEKAAYYRSIYDYAGLWLNSLRQRNSSSFEFDSGLFQNLMAASDEGADIYIYIREGSSIASYNLEHSSVCNDEYYAGRRLLVYKLAKTDKEVFNEDYREFLEHSRREMAEEKDPHVFLNLWKILKSVGNDYCDAFRENVSGEMNITEDSLIKGLNNSVLILQYRVNAEAKMIDIDFDVSVVPQGEWKREQSDILRRNMKKLSAVILDCALKDDSMYCVKRYFKELLIHSVIVNAGSISDLVFAHLLSQPWMDVRLREAHLDVRPHMQDSRFGRHKLHRTIFVTIERLENLRMRRVPDMKGYFVNTFRSMVCPEVDEENFEQTLRCITGCCEKFHHTGSSLCLNSTLING